MHTRTIILRRRTQFISSGDQTLEILVFVTALRILIVVYTYIEVSVCIHGWLCNNRIRVGRYYLQKYYIMDKWKNVVYLGVNNETSNTVSLHRNIYLHIYIKVITFPFFSKTDFMNMIGTYLGMISAFVHHGQSFAGYSLWG